MGEANKSCEDFFSDFILWLTLSPYFATWISSTRNAVDERQPVLNWTKVLAGVGRGTSIFHGELSLPTSTNHTTPD